MLPVCQRGYGWQTPCVTKAENLKVVSPDEKNEGQVLLITFPHNHGKQLNEHIYQIIETLENYLNIKMCREFYLAY